MGARTQGVDADLAASPGPYARERQAERLGRRRRDGEVEGKQTWTLAAGRGRQGLASVRRAALFGNQSDLSSGPAHT